MTKVARRITAVVLFLVAILALLVSFVGAMMTNWRGAPEQDREIETYPMSADGAVDLPADMPIEFGVPGSIVPEGEHPATPSCTLRGPEGEVLDYEGGNAAFGGSRFWSFGHFTTSVAGTYTVECGAFMDELAAQTYPWTTADQEREDARTHAIFWLAGGGVVAAASLWGMTRALRPGRRTGQVADR